LSTPPAFNLSQNQTLQFKSVAKISVGRKSESQSSFPFAIHLSMNHTDSLGAKQLFTPLRFRCQQVFFIFAKVFFRGPVGATRWREGDLCLIFKPASRTFFCHPEKFLFPSSFRTWPARWRERLYAPFRSHRQAFSRKKFVDLQKTEAILD
ncbi:hypothetical protein, partial [Desulfovibrio sp.]|uniref:hypothetical protein n=1 Tax=Desulfovibrio sp. TaxID=885 RepID=UPI003AB26BBF